MVVTCSHFCKPRHLKLCISGSQFMLAYVHLTKLAIYSYMHANKPPGGNYSTVWSVALKVYMHIPSGCWLGAGLQKQFIYAHRSNKSVPKTSFTVPHHHTVTQIFMPWLENCQILLLVWWNQNHYTGDLTEQTGLLLHKVAYSRYNVQP
jgi:hypothetical protein